MSDEPKENPPRDLQFSLEKPVRANGEDLTVIHMRKPTAGDLIRVGSPVTLNYDEMHKPVFDFAKLQAMIVRLADIPSAAIEQMSTRDLIGIGVLLSPFFYPS